MTGPETSFIACAVASTRVQAVFDVMLNGFNDDDSVVDYNADCQDKPEQSSAC